MLPYGMRLEWLEDILAVAETGSFSEAAERRGLTQSAFSRRIRLIEERIGVELFDRSHKPVALRATTMAQHATMARLAGQLRALQRDLSEGAEGAGRRITIASQHALTATRTTALIETLRKADPRIRVELISDNLDACFASLLARRADMAVVYREPGAEHPVRADFVEVMTLGADRLVPVLEAAAAARAGGAVSLTRFPFVVYPSDVFFGQVLDRMTFRREGQGAVASPIAETALTIAALEMARAGIGVAWVPKALAAQDITRGKLADLSSQLPSAALEITAVRLRGEARAAGQLAWTAFETDAAPSA